MKLFSSKRFLLLLEMNLKPVWGKFPTKRKGRCFYSRSVQVDRLIGKTKQMLMNYHKDIAVAKTRAEKTMAVHNKVRMSPDRDVVRSWRTFPYLKADRQALNSDPSIASENLSRQLCSCSVKPQKLVR